MHYNFIEIGTSDFDTLLETCEPGVKGLSIEPLLLYLNNLPEVEGVTKLNYAISNFNGEIKVYWVTPETIQKYNLPKWIRGCNSINTPHPTVDALLSNLGILHEYRIDVCKAITWNSLIHLHQIDSIDLLKIDTEGHDAIILNAIANSSPQVLPNKIIFEKNELSNHTLLNKAIDDLIKLGYKLTSSDLSINQTLEL